MNPMILSMLASGGTGLLSAFASLFGNPQSDAAQQAMDMLQGDLGNIGGTAYGKDEMEQNADAIGQIYRGGANVASGGIGSNLAESMNAAGIPQGQAQASMYTSELAPVIAEGENRAADTKKWGINTFADMDNQAKSRKLAGYQTLLSGSQYLPQQNWMERALGSFFGGANLGASGWGNLVSGWNNSKKAGRVF